MTYPSVVDWWHGDADALMAGRDALTKLGWLSDHQPDTRRAVVLWQKKRGHRPTGWLSGRQWVALLDEARQADDDEDDHADDDPEEDQ